MHWTKTTVILYLIFLTGTKSINNHLNYCRVGRKRREQGRKNRNSDLVLSYCYFWQGKTVIKMSK